ncbi:hypothetical protein PCLA_11r0266 [Pseudomonas citronellolis]|nr:hypothetical protein PCLA_11r0266 [Pseudomonas citronellolis]
MDDARQGRRRLPRPPVARKGRAKIAQRPPRHSGRLDREVA